MSLASVLLTAFKTVLFSGCIAGCLLSCNSRNTEMHRRQTSQSVSDWELNEPRTDDLFVLGDTLQISLSPLKPDLKIDSVRLYPDGESETTEINPALSFTVAGILRRAGRQNLRMRIFYNDSLSQSVSVRITVLSDTPPEHYSYRKLREIPHDVESFTQGYFYHKGYLYEGTGRERNSKLRKIDPANGKVVLERKMDDEIFGEGITLYKDNIYQLTYQNKIGFVYDLKTFEQLREFDLQTFEGWGLTNNGTDLIVSDGSSVLYFYDPEYFNQTRQLDVCSDKRLVTSLNELEYTNNAIWANVYGEQYLVKIDEKTGKVLGELDLSGLYPENVPVDYSHVLNGIAWNPEKNTFYVTGKLWPVVYEIEILD